MASFYLAQLGAEVIKIESPFGGDVLRASPSGDPTADAPSGFAAFNAGKRSLAVDIRRPEGAALVRELALSCDAFVENFRPGVVARHGLDYASLKAIKPDLVYCSISAYGQQGEWAGRGAYDHVVQALTGMTMLSGDEGEPVKVGFPVIDVGTGLVAAMSVMAALMGRLRHGKGEYIDASMVQASLALMYPVATAFLSEGKTPGRLGNRGHSGSPAADIYPCSDGWLSVAANTPAQFRSLAALLGFEHLCDDAAVLDVEAFSRVNGGFVVARDAEPVRVLLREAFAGRSAAEMEQLLNQHGIPAARVRTPGEFLAEVEAQPLVTLPFTQYGAGTNGSARTAGLGFAVGEGQGSGASKAGAPSLGADTAAILAALGKSPDDIERLQRDGVIACREPLPA